MSTRLQYVSPAQLQCVSSSALCQLSCHLSTQLSTQLQLVSSAVSSTPLARMYFVISVFLFVLCPPVSSTVFSQLDTDLLFWLQSVSLVVMCQLSYRMSVQVQTVSSAATSYHLHFAHSQAKKVCPISSGVSHLHFAIATAIAAAQLLSCTL